MNSLGYRSWSLCAPEKCDPVPYQEQSGRRFKLDDEDLQALKRLDKKLRLNDPSENFGWEFYVGEDGKS
jgi:hypothetical protein